MVPTVPSIIKQHNLSTGCYNSSTGHPLQPLAKNYTGPPAFSVSVATWSLVSDENRIKLEYPVRVGVTEQLVNLLHARGSENRLYHCTHTEAEEHVLGPGSGCM